MDKQSRQPGSDQELIQSLLQQRAAERAHSRRWNLYSLLLIWLVLGAVITLRLSDINMYLVGAVAIIGLSGFWFYSFRQGKILEKKFYNQETEFFHNQSAPQEKAYSISSGSVAEVSPLSNREMEVLSLIVKGNSNKEIAKLMNITPQTTKNHITHILKKLNVNDRTSAAVMALSQGWVKHGSDGQFEVNSNKNG